MEEECRSFNDGQRGRKREGGTRDASLQRRDERTSCMYDAHTNQQQYNLPRAIEIQHNHNYHRRKKYAHRTTRAISS